MRHHDRLLALTVVVGAWASMAGLVADRHGALYAQAPPLELTAVADTWGWNTLLGTPPAPQMRGGAPELAIVMDDTRGLAATFVRFDLSSLPAGVDVTSARLELFALSSSDPRPVHTARVHVVSAPWDEATLTDEQLPRFDVSVFVETKPVQGEWARWDVTDAVRGWLAGFPNNGLAVTTATGLFFRQNFSSREGTSPPRLLIVAASTTPTPTIRPTATPIFDGPDLTGFAWTGCFSNAIQVEVRNEGMARASAFNVRAPSGHPAWRVDGLGAGLKVKLAPQRGDMSQGILLDADNEVHETDETNNHIFVAVPSCLGLFLPWAASNR